MCGLAGIIIKEKDRSKEDLSYMVNGFQEMLLEADTRGGHATGYAFVNRSGSSIIVKRPLDAYELLEDKVSMKSFDLVNNNTGCILGHTRYATVGKPERNRNNHPIRTGNTIGTHNGSIHNHSYLFNKFEMQRYADVDSEAIFRLYDTSKSAKDFSENRLPVVRGRIAIVWSDLEYPEYVYMVKGNNPLEMVYVPDFDIYAYGSTMQIIKAAQWMKYEQITIKPNTMLRINTKSLNIDMKSITHKKPIMFKNQVYNKKIGAYTSKKYNDTVQGFVPRYSHKEQQELFKKIKASDGSTIRRIK